MDDELLDLCRLSGQGHREVTARTPRAKGRAAKSKAKAVAVPALPPEDRVAGGAGQGRDDDELLSLVAMRGGPGRSSSRALVVADVAPETR